MATTISPLILSWVTPARVNEWANEFSSRSNPERLLTRRAAALNYLEHAEFFEGSDAELAQELSEFSNGFLSAAEYLSAIEDGSGPGLEWVAIRATQIVLLRSMSPRELVDATNLYRRKCRSAALIPRLAS